MLEKNLTFEGAFFGILPKKMKKLVNLPKKRAEIQKKKMTKYQGNNKIKEFQQKRM